MLFNKDNKGSLELFELSGTFPASTDFRAIATEIHSATIDLRAIVGANVVEKAETKYVSTSPSSDDLEYVDYVRRPIAFLAISNYSRLTGLSHGDTGRKLKVDDNEKVAFEWQIDRDDRAMRERYFRSLDALFNYLLEKDDEDFHSSELYGRKSASIVGSLSELESIYPVGHSHYTYFMLLPLFLEAQDKLAKLIGQDNFNALDQDALVSARKYVALSAIVTAVSRWSITVFPQEVARQFSPSYQGNRERRAAEISEIEYTVKNLNKQIADAEADLKVALEIDELAGVKLIPDNDPSKKYFTV